MGKQPKASIQMGGLAVIPKEIKPAFPLFPNFMEREEPAQVTTPIRAKRKSFLDGWGK
ncbi:hypothetical protein ES703_92180 [subsurface metagenome]